jgi:hypothetical protein
MESNPRGVGLARAVGGIAAISIFVISAMTSRSHRRRPATGLNHSCRIDDGAVAGRKNKARASLRFKMQLPQNPLLRHPWRGTFDTTTIGF